MSSPEPVRRSSRILNHEKLSPTIFRLTFERGDFSFQAGKEIMIHGRDFTEDRQYSLASGEQDDALEVIYRIIPEGLLTPQLQKLKLGDRLDFTGPFGSFVLHDFLRPVVFFATGTGIAPAISFVRSYPGIDLRVIHGIRTVADIFAQGEFPSGQYSPCLSGEQVDGTYHGRVTHWLEENTLPAEAHVYLCGANPMILDVRKLLKARGLADDQIFTEAYYFW